MNQKPMPETQEPRTKALGAGCWLLLGARPWMLGAVCLVLVVGRQVLIPGCRVSGFGCWGLEVLITQHQAPTPITHPKYLRSKAQDPQTKNQDPRNNPLSAWCWLLGAGCWGLGACCRVLGAWSRVMGLGGGCWVLCAQGLRPQHPNPGTLHPGPST